MEQRGLARAICGLSGAIFVVLVGGSLATAVDLSAPTNLRIVQNLADLPEGFGANTPGGTGKPVYRVSNLNDSGAGSLREALSSGNRNITFDISGTIALSGPIDVQGAFITLDGSSAPAPGITLQNYGLRLRQSSVSNPSIPIHDIIIRGIRIRNAGNNIVGPEDGIMVAFGSNNIYIEHVSIEGSSDGNLDITEGAHDVTVAWSILAKPDPDQKNMLLTYKPYRLTLHHNLFVSATQRNPNMAYDPNNHELATDTSMDMRNNLVWGWGGGLGTRIRDGARANLVNNYYYAGGGSGAKPDKAVIICREGFTDAISCPLAPESFARVFVQGNYSLDGVELNDRGTETIPFNAPSVTTIDAETAACNVRKSAGALPRDATDLSYLSGVTIPGCSP